MCYHDTILFERQYDAAPHEVFAKWADPKARVRWGVPSEGSAIEYFETDFRIGGRDTSRCGPLHDLRYHVDVVYIDIIENEQIIMSETIMDDENRLSISLITVNFKENRHGTILDMVIQISSMVGKDMVDGCRTGWDAALNNLKGEFISYGKFKKRLEFSRRFKATAEQVFDAWLDPEIASYWLFSNPNSDMSKRKIKIDARVGGSYSVIENVDGQDLEALGDYIEIDRPNKLVFTFGMPIFCPEFDTVTVTIVSDGDGCILTLSHEHLPPEYHDDIENGWGKMYIRLEEILDKKKD